MKRKILGVFLLGALLLSACTQEPIKNDVKQATGTENTGAYNSDEKNVDSGKEGAEVKCMNLTQENETEICIDYAIADYEPVQSFSYELFKQNMEEDNPVLSPVSAYLALALVGKGAEGETQEAFLEVFKDLEVTPHDLMQELPREDENQQIRIANSAWVDYQLNLNGDWITWADSVYKSEVYQTNLAAEDTYLEMNKWIEEKTKGLIPQLYEKPFEEDARLVLLNTLYFKGKWANSFKAADTREDSFVLADGSVEQVQMMHMTGEPLRYVREGNAEGVILPYQDETMVFLALKPAKGGTVRELYEDLSFETIISLAEQEELTLCNLKLPKFQAEFHKELNDSLKRIGLEIAFVDGEADFRGIGIPVNAPNMYINKVEQKSKVIVDEEGTEAAAVTSIAMVDRCAYNPELPVEIYFDEPFIYMIMDMERKVPLFMGIMDNPNK